ncbi:hypothetical protein Tco_1238474 [Tanacetum coccineum]
MGRKLQMYEFKLLEDGQSSIVTWFSFVLLMQSAMSHSICLQQEVELLLNVLAMKGHNYWYQKLLMYQLV